MLAEFLDHVRVLIYVRHCQYNTEPEFNRIADALQHIGVSINSDADVGFVDTEQKISGHSLVKCRSVSVAGGGLCDASESVSDLRDSDGLKVAGFVKVFERQGDV